MILKTINIFYDNIYLKKIFLVFFLLSFYLFLLNKIEIYKKNQHLSYKGVALCVIAKNENLYINEFITYYKKLGIRKIFLYDNNDKYGENFTDVISGEI